MSTNPVENLSDCEDTTVLINAFNSNSNVFDVRAAGTAMRFMTAFLSGMEGEWELRGTERMHQRPIYPLVDALRELGADIEYLEKEGCPPLKIKGRRLEGGEVSLSGSISSQYISALMMVAPTMTNGLDIHIQDEIISHPYLRLTASLMEQYGAKVKWEDKHIVIKPQQYQQPQNYRVEADWSAASYWYAMVALKPGAEVTLMGLNRNSAQGDANLVGLFTDLGVTTEYIDGGVVVRNNGKRSKIFYHNFINEPDLAQTFAAACCFLSVPFMFSGLQTLRIKETDRIEALRTELKKFGYVIQVEGDEVMRWDGERCLVEEEAVVATYEDHRMAMSMALAAMVTDSVKINDPHVVAKSYPGFWDDLEHAGFEIIKEKR